MYGHKAKDPCTDCPQNEEQGPVLHEVRGHDTTVTTHPVADVLPIHLVAHVILAQTNPGRFLKDPAFLEDGG